MGVEERDADSHVGLHLPPPHCGPRSAKPAASASERGGLLHQHAKGEGEDGRAEARGDGGVPIVFVSLEFTLVTPTLSVVYGVSDHRQRSGSSAAERGSDPRDGAGVERPAAQPTSPQSSVHR